MVLKKTKVLSVVFLFIAQAGATLANESAIERLFQLSGNTAAIHSLSKTLEHQLSPDTLTAEVGDPAFAAALSHSMLSNFNPALFHSKTRKSVRESLTTSEINKILTWFDTPLGQRVAVANQADLFQISLRIEAGERPQVSAERSRMIETLDKVLMRSDRNIQLAIDAGAVLGHSMMSAMGIPASLSDIRPAVKMQVMAEKEKMVEEFHATIGFLYESLSDDDFRQLIAAQSDPEHTIFNDAIWNGLSEAFYQASASLGNTLTGELNGGI